jgi:glucokinase
MKAAVLVNGVPASGKSTLARALAERTGWGLFALDTVKEALFAHLGTGDRAHNRRFGQASYQAIFSVLGDFPDGATAIIDAWFGFQPEDVLRAHLQRGGIGKVAQVWCAAAPEVVAARYRARAAQRSQGHLGPEYADELAELARRAQPIASIETLTVDANAPIEAGPVAEWLERWRRGGG